MREEPSESLGVTVLYRAGGTGLLLNQLKTFEAVLKMSLSERWWWCMAGSQIVGGRRDIERKDWDKGLGRRDRGEQ